MKKSDDDSQGKERAEQYADYRLITREDWG